MPDKFNIFVIVSIFFTLIAHSKIGQLFDRKAAEQQKIYNEDMFSLGVLPPDIQPHATEYIKEMIELIQDWFHFTSYMKPGSYTYIQH